MSSEGPSALGAHLAEMDILLRDIQADLVPGREPAPALGSDTPSRGPPGPAPPARPAPDPKIEVLNELSAHLLASMRELLAGYERMLVGRSSPRPARRAARRPSEAPDVTLSAAPFRSVEALREFERVVSNLPGVREVTVQGYEGSDRAIIEVRLGPS